MQLASLQSLSSQRQTSAQSMHDNGFLTRLPVRPLYNIVIGFLMRVLSLAKMSSVVVYDDLSDVQKSSDTASNKSL